MSELQESVQLIYSLALEPMHHKSVDLHIDILAMFSERPELAIAMGADFYLRPWRYLSTIPHFGVMPPTHIRSRLAPLLSPNNSAL